MGKGHIQMVYPSKKKGTLGDYQLCSSYKPAVGEKQDKM